MKRNTLLLLFQCIALGALTAQAQTANPHAQTRAAQPQAPRDAIHIHLERGACFGTCPVYSVDIYGDGRVIYRAERFAAVLGTHGYRIPTSAVTQLAASVDAKNIWASASRYHVDWTDLPTYTVSVTIGNRTHTIEDYGGVNAGMPLAIQDFETEIDTVADIASWIELSPRALDRLSQEGFDFSSQDAAQILVRALKQKNTNDDATARLVQLSVPLETQGFDDNAPELRSTGPDLLRTAMDSHRPATTAALIARGIKPAATSDDAQ